MAIARKFGDNVYFWNVPDRRLLKTYPYGLVSTAIFDLDIDAWFGEA